MAKPIRLVAAAAVICFTVPACGPILDLRDHVSPRYGPSTPYGELKRDFWGRRYLVPYPDQMQRAREEVDREAAAASLEATRAPTGSDGPAR